MKEIEINKLRFFINSNQKTYCMGIEQIINEIKNQEEFHYEIKSIDDDDAKRNIAQLNTLISYLKPYITGYSLNYDAERLIINKVKN